MKYRLVLLLILPLFQVTAQQIDLKSFYWNFSSDTLSVQDVDPSDVYLALLSKGIIDEPFYRDNEKHLQWASKHDWTFETDFQLPATIRNHDRIEMIFEGLDTYAKVYLNGQLILDADNMFRTWVIDVKSNVKNNNHLKVVFKSPLKVIKAAREAGDWKLPYDYGYVRKAPYHFGWDWGPTFITCGIWRPAYLRIWDNTRITDVYVEQKSVDSLKAEVNLNINIESERKIKGYLFIYRDSALLIKKSVKLLKGNNKIIIPDKIENPKLWWPNGMGEANLYKYNVVFKYRNQIQNSVTLTTGLRTIELVQQPDSAGKSFYFKVNGISVFAKGANYIPPDNFLPRVSDEKYKQIIEDAKKANMNMLRIWGGGTYEKDIFYRLCDENGIMVWQDFMFACNMSPGDSAFLENVKTEAEENVKRLRNHPSIALWCGNNEVDEAWHNWGWQKQYHYSKEDSAKLWNAYLDIFENILPKTVNQYAPNTFYWPSSPSIGWGHKEAFTQGDAHYWEVWWGRKPFSYYEKKIGRFMSEYGFQGMPDMKTINEFTLPEDRKMGSKVLDVHQKHPFGWKAIQQYMERDFPVPDNLEEYDYVSQLLQAEGIGMAIEAHRRSKPYCMGTLYWQLNDCWPVVSWSSFDYYGRWKALHYTVKKDYAPFLISFDTNSDSLRIWVINDLHTKTEAILQWAIMDFSGNILASGNQKQFTEPNSSKVSYSINKNLFISFDSTSTVLNAVLIEEDSTLLAENNYYFAKPKNLQLEKPEITIHLNKQKNGYLIRLKSDKLTRGVQLSTNVDGFFEDNYFDILPGETKTLFFTTDHIFNKEDLKIRSLYNITTLQ